MFEFEENSLYQEGIISKAYQRPDISYFQEPKELESLENTGRLVQRFLPKQADIYKILKIMQWKVLKGTHLSIMIKDMQAGYLISSYFKDIHLYLAQNKLPSAKSVIRKIEALGEKIHITRFTVIWNNINSRQRNSSISNTGDMCR